MIGSLDSLTYKKKEIPRRVFSPWTNIEMQEMGDSEGLPLLKYPLLEQIDFIDHCFTTRLGGVSEGIWASLNLSFSRGDNPDCVSENYRRVAAVFGRKPEDIVTSDQTHTTNVRRVGKEHCGTGVTRPREFTDVDGLITNEPGVILATFYADCVPLYFVDPVHKAIGLSHSGWRGTVGRMGKVTLEHMAKEFGTKAEDVIAAIGPSICQSCYEVSEDVAEAFAEEFGGRLDSVSKKAYMDGNDRELLYPTIPGKYQLNLWEANRRVLLEAGILEEHLQVTELCTCCNPDLLFSHRASQGKRGNLGAFLVIKS